MTPQPPDIQGDADMPERERKLVSALRGMLSDYRTEGCPNPDCIVCRRSKTAVAKAHIALAAYDRSRK